MAQLFLLRHLKSQWNLENRFTGWTNVPLCQEGIDSAKTTAAKLSGYKIDKIYTSPLARNVGTVSLVLQNLGQKDLPVIIDKALDERNYGRLQGLNKDEVKKKYGPEQVQLWRRGWKDKPPGGESLKDVYKRAVSYFKKNIEKDLKNNQNVLVVASHNSLRALLKYVEKIPDKDIVNHEMDYAELRVYELDERLKIKSRKIV